MSADSRTATSPGSCRVLAHQRLHVLLPALGRGSRNSVVLLVPVSSSGAMQIKCSTVNSSH